MVIYFGKENIASLYLLEHNFNTYNLETRHTEIRKGLHLHLNYSPSEISKKFFLNKWPVYYYIKPECFLLNLTRSLLMSAESPNIPGCGK